VLYGTVSQGNPGIFSILPSGADYRLIVSRCFAYALGADGFLYGSSGNLGAFGGGELIRIRPDGSGYSIVHSFAPADGEGRNLTALTDGRDGFLYGATAPQINVSSGAVFKVRPDGSGFQVLHDFGDRYYSGTYIPGTVSIVAQGSNLYGVTKNKDNVDVRYIWMMQTDGSRFQVLNLPVPGDPDLLTVGDDGHVYGSCNGPSAVFRFSMDGNDYLKLHDFALGEGVGVTGLAFKSGDLYGTCNNGGSYSSGTFWQIKSDGTLFAAGHHFGATPEDGRAGLGILASSDGYLYGHTIVGGLYNYGTMWRALPDGSDYTTLRSFNPISSLPASPIGRLSLAPNGVLYGASAAGGQFNRGAIYKINQDGSGLTTLLSLADSSSRGQYPREPLLSDDGNLYVACLQGGVGSKGTVFKLSTNGASVAVLHSFQGGVTDGDTPLGPLVEGIDQFLYGITSSGGTNNSGVLFRIGRDGAGFAIIRHFKSATFGYDNSPARLFTTADGFLIGWDDGVGLFEIKPDATSFRVISPSTVAPLNLFSVSSMFLSQEGLIYLVANASRLLSVDRTTGSSASLPFFPDVATRPSQISGRLLIGVDGYLYGTSKNGGIYGNGSIYRVTTNGYDFSICYSFQNTGPGGSSPESGLVAVSETELLGTTPTGGTDGALVGNGSIFLLKVPPPINAPVFTSSAVTNGLLILSWMMRPGKFQQLQCNTNLGGSDWIGIGATVPATNTNQQATQPLSALGNKLFRILQTDQN